LHWHKRAELLNTNRQLDSQRHDNFRVVNEAGVRRYRVRELNWRSTAISEKKIKMIINLKKMTDYSLTFVIPSCQSTYIRRFSSCFDRLACWKFRRHRGNARASSFTFDTEWG